MSLDLSSSFYTAIIGFSDVTALLGEYLGSPSVHTRTPVPVGAEYPMVLVRGPISITNQDFLSSQLPIIVTDIIAYGEQDKDFRDVETIAYLLQQHFHRQRTAITVSGYNVMDLEVDGPSIAPTDDLDHVGRLISVTTSLSGA